MPGRRLNPEERALWRKVTADVRPLQAEAPAPETPPPPIPEPTVVPAFKRRTTAVAAPAIRPAVSRPSVDTLDGGWDRRLRRGLIAPERSIDLHGHTLASAYAALEAALAQAVADEVRLLLVITGRPPRAGSDGRGRIRAAIGDWLAGSSQAGRIAAVRSAHPRHGGAGALYLILRRRR